MTEAFFIMKNEKTKIIVEGALMLALAVVLTMITPFKRILPFGGSITLMAMLPVCLFSIKRGLKYGFALSFAYALYQLAFGIAYEGLFAWGLTGPMLAGSIFLDYLFPFSILFLGGLFRYKGLGGWVAGTVVAMVLKYISHVVSGIVIFASSGKIWDGLDFVAKNKYTYSLVYNAATMVPELILTTIGVVMAYKLTHIRKLFEPVPAKNNAS